MKMVFNYSKKHPYYSQVNNKRYPETSCKNTSLVMALLQAGWSNVVDKLTFKKLFVTIQPEDFLTEIADLPGLVEQTIKIAPHLKDSPMYQIPQNSVLLLNFLLGQNKAKLVLKWNISDLTRLLNNGFGVAALGQIVTPNDNKYNHVVSISGYIEQDEIITDIIIDDPYGQYKTNYTNKKGNDVTLPFKDFDNFFLKYKWSWLIVIEPNR